ncbi:MAG: asparagine synthase-related protein [Reyranella sp.]|nr:asparagine synthase-related protein [Reyranella sp.]MDP3161633.1 asparagine synthase-related protein [Reyranella sp.]
MFAAVFNLHAESLDVHQLGDASDVKLFGDAGRAAFVCSTADSSGPPGEESVLHSLGGRYWIVGRIRLDAGRELQARLAAEIGNPPEAIPDALLCLHAYARWGERFTEFLAGDFAFALWDDERQSLIAVRDQMGVRLLFHARKGNTWFVGDSLDWIAARASTGRDLDDYWIADFLTGGCSREFERTIYRDIQRLAPAHTLKLNQAGAAIRSYWRLNVVEPVYFRDPRTYTERFRELLSLAVADRLPAGRVGIALSGGLDSTALAASTLDVTADASRIVAECEHYEEAMHIREDYFASLAARRLGIDLRIRVVDELVYDPQWRARDIRSAEPSISILNAYNIRQIDGDRARAAPVWLEGEGPDNALTLERNSYLGWLFGRRSWGRLAGALLQYARVKGIAGWTQTLRRHAGPQPEAKRPDTPPPWLNRDFAERLKLAERLATLGEGGDTSHPWRPLAIASFTSPFWQNDLDDMNFREQLAPIVRRHPYLDLRVTDFMLSVPPVPWGWKKHLMREAMRDRLPAEVLGREKTPLACYPDVASMRKHGLPEPSRGSRFERYVDRQQLPTVQASETEIYFAMAAYSLDHWLTHN